MNGRVIGRVKSVTQEGDKITLECYPRLLGPEDFRDGSDQAVVGIDLAGKTTRVGAAQISFVSKAFVRYLAGELINSPFDLIESLPGLPAAPWRGYAA